MRTILPFLNKMKNPGTRIIIEELYRAEKEDGIRLLQRALVALGKKIAIDGVLGEITTAAVKSVNNRALHGVLWDFRHPTPPKALGHLPAWVAAGLREIGVHEIRGVRHNPRVIAYMNATKWGKWVHDDETPWCAGFVGWCMVQAGLREQIPDYSLGAKSWLHFGVSAHKPVFGAIAVKSRHGVLRPLKTLPCYNKVVFVESAHGVLRPLKTLPCYNEWVQHNTR